MRTFLAAWHHEDKWITRSRVKVGVGMRERGYPGWSG